MEKSQTKEKYKLKMDSRENPGMWINYICIKI